MKLPRDVSSVALERSLAAHHHLPVEQVLERLNL